MKTWGSATLVRDAPSLSGGDVLCELFVPYHVHISVLPPTVQRIAAYLPNTYWV